MRRPDWPACLVSRPSVVEPAAYLGIMTPGEITLNVVRTDPADNRYLECALEGAPWRSPGRYAGDGNRSVDVSLLVAALAHAGGEGAVVELRRREEQGRAPAERLLELQPSNGRGHPARVGIRDQLRAGDVRPFPRGRTARREHDEE